MPNYDDWDENNQVALFVDPGPVLVDGKRWLILRVVVKDKRLTKEFGGDDEYLHSSLHEIPLEATPLDLMTWIKNRLPKEVESWEGLEPLNFEGTLGDPDALKKLKFLGLR